MKLRRGFVTNSSSTNQIFQALGTAGAAAALGTIINTIQPAKNVRIVSYALLETIHMPEAPKPPVIRVNDSQYVVWYYAGVRIIDVQSVSNPKTKSVDVTVIRDDYDPTYTSAITFGIPESFANDWLLFGGDTDEGGIVTMMQGDYKLCGFLCASPYNDSPRSQRPNPPSLLAFNVSVNVDGKQLSKYKETHIRDEAELVASFGYAINDPSVTTRIPITLYNKDQYTWQIDFEVIKNRLEDLADLHLKSLPPKLDKDALCYELEVKPKGLPLGSEDKPSNQYSGRIEVTGKADASHLEEVWDYLEVKLVDEGLIYIGKCNKDQQLEVLSYHKDTDEDQVADGIEIELPPTDFKLNLVVKEGDEEDDHTAMMIDMENAEVAFGPLEGMDPSTEKFVDSYDYEVEVQGTMGDYIFKPKMQIPDYDKDYLLKLPIRCTYEGQTYELEMPIQLLGEPFDAEGAWEDEYKNLRIIVKKYIPQERWYDILTNINDHKDSLSIEDLRLMRRALWIEARNSLMAESAAYSRDALMYEWAEWGASWVEWVGNQAFSYLMTVYTGPVGDAILTPFKEMLVKILARKIADARYGDSKQMTGTDLQNEGLGAAFSMVENVIMDGAGNAVGKPLSLKEMGRYFAAYAVVRFFNNYALGKKPDGTPFGIWDCIVATCKDLTSGFFKTIIGQKFDDMLKDSKFMDAINGYTIKKFQTTLAMEFPDWSEQGIDVTVKYFSGLIGVMSAKAYDSSQTIAATGQFGADGNDLILTFNVSLDPKKPIELKVSFNQIKADIYTYIFDSYFGTFPFAPKAITITDKPKYYKKSI